MKEHILEEIRRRKIITIVRGVYGEQAVRLARALAEGGIGIMEVTFDPRSPQAQRRLWKRSAHPGRMGGAMIVGAGTVHLRPTL